MERSSERNAPGDWDTTARLRRRLHVGTTAECENPKTFYDFIIDVEAGIYDVEVRVGDGKLKTDQRLTINGKSAGRVTTDVNQFITSRNVRVSDENGRLIIRFHLNGDQVAAVNSISFYPVSAP